jgi:hypothetical protein
VSQKRDEIAVRQIDVELHGRREATKQRRNRRLIDVLERHRLDFGRKRQRSVREIPVVRLDAQLLTVARDQAKRDRNDHRLLDVLAWRRRRRLREFQSVRARRGVIFALRRDHRGSRLLVPAEELRQIPARSFREAGDELLHRRRLSVMTVEVKRDAVGECVVADQAIEHADDLGALLVDGRRVEVVDLAVLRRSHGMGEGA